MAPSMKAMLVSAALFVPAAGDGHDHEGDDHGDTAMDGWTEHAGKACRIGDLETDTEANKGVEGTNMHRLTLWKGSATDAAHCKTQCEAWEADHGKKCHAVEVSMAGADLEYCEIWTTMVVESEAFVGRDCHKLADGVWTPEEGMACRMAGDNTGGTKNVDFVELKKSETNTEPGHTVKSLDDCKHKCKDWSQNGESCHAIEAHLTADGMLKDYCEIWITEPMGTVASEMHSCMKYSAPVESKSATAAPESDASSAPVAAALAGSAALAMVAAIVV